MYNKEILNFLELEIFGEQKPIGLDHFQRILMNGKNIKIYVMNF